MRSNCNRKSKGKGTRTFCGVFSLQRKNLPIGEKIQRKKGQKVNPAKGAYVPQNGRKKGHHEEGKFMRKKRLRPSTSEDRSFVHLKGNELETKNEENGVTEGNPRHN